MTALENLARRLAEAAARHRDCRGTTPQSGPDSGSGGALNVRAVFEPIAPEDVPSGYAFYGRAIWPLGDDITDDRILVEGTARRSYAALNHYLRADEDLAADRARGLPRHLPEITVGWVGFARADDTVCVAYYQRDHHEADQHGASTEAPAAGSRGPGAATVAVLVADR